MINKLIENKVYNEYVYIIQNSISISNIILKYYTIRYD